MMPMMLNAAKQCISCSNITFSRALSDLHSPNSNVLWEETERRM
jgi:hypothetical protein